MSTGETRAAAFVTAYGSTWERWDVDRFVDLFTADVIYVVHPTEETVVGSEALRVYFGKEKEQQGSVSVRMGTAVAAEDRVAAEFWAQGVEGDLTIAGCFIAKLDGATGRCSHFREYWFDLEGQFAPDEDWGV
jgi:ketosteroid isomerase-like protein